jgi:hypothetical protein
MARDSIHSVRIARAADALGSGICAERVLSQW